jgi:tetratricopeptide (TPR) repeat protein
MRSDGPNSPRSPGLDSIAPGALKAASLPQSGAPRAAAAKGVRLSLEEEDAQPERERSGSGGRWLLYVAAAAVLGGGAFAIARSMSEAAKEPAALTPAPLENPATPAATDSADASLAAVDPTSPAAPAPVAEAQPEPAAPATPAPASNKPAASDKPASAAKAEPSPPSKSTSADKPSSGEGSGTAREPKDYAGWVGRGEQMLAKRDLAGAQQAFQTAVGLRGTGSEANSGLGAALLGQGQTREAIPYLTRAASNGFAEASVSLGDAYRKLGDKDNAIEAYETYLARLPKGARASYVKLQLEGLGKEVGGPKPEAPAAREPESHAAPNNDYRPAGEMNEPAPAPAPSGESPQ